MALTMWPGWYLSISSKMCTLLALSSPIQEGQNLIQIAIESSLPAPRALAASNERQKRREAQETTTEAPANPYQITPHSHLCASASENHHMLWWLFSQYEQEQHNPGRTMPFTETLRAAFQDKATLESTIHLLDIDPSLFFRVMMFVRDELSITVSRDVTAIQDEYALDTTDEDKIVWMHERFKALHGGTTLQDTIRAKEVASVHQFIIINMLREALNSAKWDLVNTSLRNARDIRASISEIEELIHRDINVSENQDYPDYVKDLDACRAAIRDIKARSNAAKAQRQEGDLTPTTGDYLEQGLAALNRKMARGELPYSNTFVPRYLGLMIIN